MDNKRINLLVDAVKIAMIIAASCALVSVIVFMVSDAPLVAIKSFFLGPFDSLRHICNIVEGATPLIFTGLAVTIIFRAGQFSMISEGAFFVGACGAMMAGISLKLPPVIHPIVSILCGALLGAIAASIPAVLKLRFGTSELVTSIMLNYVCLHVTLYLMNYHFRDTETTAFQSEKVQETAKLARIIPDTRIHVGIIIAFAICIIVWFLLFRTRFGFKLRVTGDSVGFANYVGIGAAGIVFVAQIIAGAVAGTAGAVELLGMYSQFQWNRLPGYGWSGIVVALLARQNPLLLPLSACFIAYLNVGAEIMSRSSDVSREVVLIIQGVMMLLIAANALLDAWRQRMIVKAAGQGDKIPAKA